MTVLELKKKRDHILDIAADLCYLIATEQYKDLNSHREQELKNLKKKLKRVDAELAKRGA